MSFYKQVKKNLWAKGINVVLSFVFIVWDIGWATGYEDPYNPQPLQEEAPLVKPEDAKTQVQHEEKLKEDAERVNRLRNQFSPLAAKIVQQGTLANVPKGPNPGAQAIEETFRKILQINQEVQQDKLRHENEAQQTLNLISAYGLRYTLFKPVNAPFIGTITPQEWFFYGVPVASTNVQEPFRGANIGEHYLLNNKGGRPSTKPNGFSRDYLNEFAVAEEIKPDYPNYAPEDMFFMEYDYENAEASPIVRPVLRHFYQTLENPEFSQQVNHPIFTTTDWRAYDIYDS